MLHSASSHVLSVAVSQPFLHECAKHLIATLGEKHLHHGIIFVPNQRTGRMLRETLAAQLPGKALLLPHIIPTQHNTRSAMLNLYAGNHEAIADFLAIPPAMDEHTRISLLAKQVQASHSMVEQFQHLPKALHIAQALASLQDEAILHHADMAALMEAIDKKSLHDYAGVLQRLFAIITQHWPNVTQAYGKISETEHQQALQECFIRHLPQLAEKHRIYVIGSTGSVASTRALMQAVAKHPRGQVIIPGAGSIPPMAQANIHINETLKALQLPPEQVHILGNNSAKEPRHKAHYFETKTSEEEARIITLLIRRTIETSNDTCLLITPDAALMKRVAGHLASINIIADSPPLSLLLYTPAIQAWLALCGVIADSGSKYRLRQCMQHCTAQEETLQEAWKACVTLLDQHALRNPRDRSFWELENASDDVRILAQDFYSLMQRLGALQSNLQTPEQWMIAIQKALTHCQFLSVPELPEPLRNALASYGPLGAIAIHEFVHLLSDIGSQPTANNALRPDARVRMLTPVEARLCQADHVIFSSFHGDYWPRITNQNAWLGTHVRAQVGLPIPDDEFALAAHDVWLHAASAKRISCTRARNDGGSITHESPLAAALTLLPVDAALTQLARVQFMPDAITPESPAAPNPPIDARPRTMRISALDTLLKDPYSIYAQYVLHLEPLDAYDTKADAREFGTLAHKLIQHVMTRQLALSQCDAWIAKETRRYPLNQAEELFWKRRLLAVAHFAEVLRVQLEQAGTRFVMEEVLQANYALDEKNSLTLDGRADLITHEATGQSSITDFKTGAPFTVSDMRDGKTAQLLGYALLLELQGLEAHRWACAELPRIHKPEKWHEFEVSADDFSKRKAAFNESVKQIFFNKTPFLAHPLLEEGVDSRRDAYDGVSRIEEWG